MKHPIPTQPELREFYLCGIRTGYSNPAQALRAAEQWDGHAAYDCEYCPGHHHVKADALHSHEKLNDYATEHWTSFVEGLSSK